jgi:hypothetical protein
MRKTILTMIGSALLAGSLAQGAAASETRHVRKVYRTPAPVSQSVRDSNAAWADTSAQPGWSGYYSGGYSAPAGR